MRRVEIESRRRVFDGFFKIEEATMKFEKFSGEMSRQVKRLNFERGDSVAAVLVNRMRRTVILVNQFKFPTFDKGPGWITEVAAGTIEAGEEPELAIRREIMEETGHTVTTLHHISTFYVSPGGSSERVVLYCAEVSGGEDGVQFGGKPEEDEDIEIIEFPIADVPDLLKRPDCADAKTIIALMWLLNQEWGRP